MNKIEYISERKRGTSGIWDSKGKSTKPDFEDKSELNNGSGCLISLSK